MNLAFLKKFRRIPSSEKIFFIEHLRVMIRAGIPLATALGALGEQTENKYFKEILGAINKNIIKGETFSSGLARYPKIFNELFVNVVRAGEVSGKLEEVLGQLYIQMKKEHDLKSKIKSALIYPTIIVSAMIVIGFIMMVFVLPKIVSIFSEVKAQLPLSTRMLIALSDFVANYIIFIIIFLILLVIAAIRVFQTNQGKYWFDFVLLKLPVISPIIKKVNLARFCRTFSSLLKTEIPLVQAIQIGAKTLGNKLYRQALEESAEKVKKGVTITEIIKINPRLFPPLFVQMVAVGEETGSLDSILEELASFYEEEVYEIMNNLPAIIEPLIILVLGAAVAWLAVAIIMPLYSLTEVI